jgi:hypothetical protein
VCGDLFRDVAQHALLSVPDDLSSAADVYVDVSSNSGESEFNWMLLRLAIDIQLFDVSSTPPHLQVSRDSDRHIDAIENDAYVSPKYTIADLIDTVLYQNLPAGHRAGICDFFQSLTLQQLLSLVRVSSYVNQRHTSITAAMCIGVHLFKYTKRLESTAATTADANKAAPRFPSLRLARKMLSAALKMTWYDAVAIELAAMGGGSTNKK